MSLITRCPTCETMFRVVPDQLRVSEGWVRCGQCTAVFDASQNMVPSPDSPDTGATAPPPKPDGTAHAPEPVAAQAPEPAPTQVADTAPVQEPEPAHESAMDIEASAAARPEAVDGARSVPEAHRTPAAADRINDWLDAPPTDPDTVILDRQDDEEELLDTVPPPVAASATPGSATAHFAASAAPETEVGRPSFLRDDAPQASIWQRPAVRIALLLVLLALLALLGAQWLIKERDRVAAVQPAMLPVLQAVCAIAGCRVAPLRQIESIVIDSSSFSRVRDDSYQLGFSLKNTAPIDVAMPAIELSLTDPQDQPVIRRVILPAEFGARTPALTRSAVWNGSLTLTVQSDANGQRIAGYRLLAFYP